MSRTFKNKLFLLLPLLIIVIAFAVIPFVKEINAQATEEIEVLSDFSDLYVSNISIQDSSFFTGETIRGSFDISNVGELAATGVTYRVELVEIYEEENVETGEVTETYSRPLDSSDTFRIGSVDTGKKSISFSYQLPDYLPNYQLGILIQVYESEDVPTALEYTPINVSGNVIPFLDPYVEVVINDEEGYSELEGPTVGKSETVTLDIYLSNYETSSISVTPTLKLFKGSDTNSDPIQEVVLDSITVPAEEETYYSYPLPVSTLDDDVYTVLVEYFDAEGITRTFPIEARYIIGDPAPRIENIFINSIDQDTVDSFVVNIEYSGAPLNIRVDENGDFVDERYAQMFVEGGEDGEPIYDESGPDVEVGYPTVSGMSAEVVVSDSLTGIEIDRKTVEFGDSIGAEVSFDPIKISESVVVEVYLYKNGELVDTDNIETPIIPKTENTLLDFILGNYIYLLIVLAIIVFLIIYSSTINKNGTGKNISSSKSSKKQPIKEKISKNIPMVMSVAFAAIAIFGALMATDSKEVDAGVVWTGNDVEVVSPKPIGVRKYDPGERIAFKAFWTWKYCGNEGKGQPGGQISDPVLRDRNHKGFNQWRSGQEVSTRRVARQIRRATGKRKKAGFNSGGGYRTRGGTVSINFRAPDEPGKYKFRYRIGARGGDGAGRLTYRTGTATFEVRDDRDFIKSLTCSASSNAVDIGESVRYRADTDTRANFRWYDGDTATGPVRSSTNDKRASAYTTSYSTSGFKTTTVTASADGRSKTCRITILVIDPDNPDEFDINDLDLENPDLLDLEDLQYVDPDGNIFQLDPNAGPPSLEFILENTVTNDICRGRWTSENVVACRLYRLEEDLGNIPLKGTDDFEPGTYRVKCIAARDGSEIVSQPRTCTGELDLQEQ